jgi:hypothetical protein
MVNPGASAAILEMDEAQAAAKMLGLDIDAFEIRRAEDIAPAFEALTFLDRGAGRMHGVIDAVLALLHLDLGRAADAELALDAARY